VSPKSQPRDPFVYGNRRGTFSSWAMAIVFATVALLSFTVDQTVSLSPNSGAQSEVSPPSLLHPVQLIEAVIDALE
jgi:hypothetical protein